MTAVAVTLLSTHPNKQAREKKIILKESRYAKRESVISFRSRFKINLNISRAKFFKIYYYRFDTDSNDKKYLEKRRKEII